jgi:ribA/ribD-fused uncharacterized protein
MPSQDTRTAPVTSLIEWFTGDYAWLSNFFECPVWREGLWYPTAEAAFQAGKTLDQRLRQRIADAPNPGYAKYLGGKLQLRPQWNDVVRHRVMADVLAAKFTSPDLAARLTATATALLIEGNMHHDQDWGCCQCKEHRERPGQNLLGLALMRQRAHLNPSIAGRWTQVAATGHRPHKIPKGLRDWVQHELARVAVKLATEHGTEVALSGLAMGSDLWWAHAARDAGLRVWGYSPYPEQDQRWPQIWRNTRSEVMRTAERVQHLGDRYDIALLGQRNRWLIRDSQALVAVVDSTRTSGGTIAAVRHAATRIPIIRIDLHTQDVRLVRPRSATRAA